LRAPASSAFHWGKMEENARRKGIPASPGTFPIARHTVRSSARKKRQKRKHQTKKTDAMYPLSRKHELPAAESEGTNQKEKGRDSTKKRGDQKKRNLHIEWGFAFRRGKCGTKKEKKKKTLVALGKKRN